MSWIDIYLSDGDPSAIYGADVEKALKSILKIQDLPYVLLSYRKAGLRIHEAFIFLFLDILRNLAYREGFIDGKVAEPEGDFK
ncbi:MAG: hypothetical protein KAR39_02750 [Thermoplasmata archaeon]|nr:hypothetical protein [Thermoplasmata archaeon]